LNIAGSLVAIKENKPFMKNGIIEKILKESKDNKKILGIRKYGEGDDFWCGYIYDFNEQLVIIQHFTKFGKPDGLIIEKIENIESIETDDDYAKSYQYLVENHNRIEKQRDIKIKICASEDWQLDTFKQLDLFKALVTIEINSDFFISGFINEFDNGFLNIKTIGKLGEDEGDCFYKIADITSIQFDRMEERKRQLLSEWRKSSK
ncbi:MAG: hypothetical protein ABFS35_13445, partial [Bacteroidota bacterium]